MVETLTKVATKSITNTKLAVATLAALAAGGAAFAIAPIGYPDLVVSNIVFDNVARIAKVTVMNIGKTSSGVSDVGLVWSGNGPATTKSVIALRPGAIMDMVAAIQVVSQSI